MRKTPRASRAAPTEARRGLEGVAEAVEVLLRQAGAGEDEAPLEAGKGQEAGRRNAHTKFRQGVSLQVRCIGQKTDRRTKRQATSKTAFTPAGDV